MIRCIFVLFFVFGTLASFGQTSKSWQGTASFEMSFGIAGYAREDGYMSVGVAATYGMLINEHYFAGLGVKPNYIFGDFDGFFMPVYGEFKYQSNINAKEFGYYGMARVGYSPVDQRGVYSHLGGGFIYRRWEFGAGVTYQYTQFKEMFFKGYEYLDYNLVFGTISVGFRF